MKACIYTGLHNHRSGILNNTVNYHVTASKLTPAQRNNPIYKRNRIAADIPTLTERLRDHGYYQAATHKLHVAPVEKFRKDWAEYLAGIELADALVGQAMDVLRASGQMERTIIVFLGDHGPTFQHGKMTPYDLGLRTPLIIAGSGIRAGATNALASEAGPDAHAAPSRRCHCAQRFAWHLAARCAGRPGKCAGAQVRRRRDFESRQPAQRRHAGTRDLRRPMETDLPRENRTAVASGAGGQQGVAHVGNRTYHLLLPHAESR